MPKIFALRSHLLEVQRSLSTDEEEGLQKQPQFGGGGLVKEECSPQQQPHYGLRPLLQKSLSFPEPSSSCVEDVLIGPEKQPLMSIGNQEKKPKAKSDAKPKVESKAEVINVIAEEFSILEKGKNELCFLSRACCCCCCSICY